MADEVDQAAEREQKAEALWQKQRSAEAAKKKQASLDCIECGERIPAARQVATGGVELCRDCAEAEELKRRHYR